MFSMDPGKCAFFLCIRLKVLQWKIWSNKMSNLKYKKFLNGNVTDFFVY